MALSTKERLLLRIAAWALRTYLKYRSPSPPEEQLHALLHPPRLVADRTNTPESPERDGRE